jgi:hypothetical protein
LCRQADAPAGLLGDWARARNLETRTLRAPELRAWFDSHGFSGRAGIDVRDFTGGVVEVELLIEAFDLIQRGFARCAKGRAVLARQHNLEASRHRLARKRKVRLGVAWERQAWGAAVMPVHQTLFKTRMKCSVTFDRTVKRRKRRAPAGSCPNVQRKSRRGGAAICGTTRETGF